MKVLHSLGEKDYYHAGEDIGDIYRTYGHSHVHNMATTYHLV
jgi:hypothetical protein